MARSAARIGVRAGVEFGNEFWVRDGKGPINQVTRSIQDPHGAAKAPAFDPRQVFVLTCQISRKPHLRRVALSLVSIVVRWRAKGHLVDMTF